MKIKNLLCKIGMHNYKWSCKRNDYLNDRERLTCKNCGKIKVILRR